MKKNSMKKIWQKTGGQQVDPLVESYTTGNDYLLDMELIPFDLRASGAHAKMLRKIGILSAPELVKLLNGLGQIESLRKAGTFHIRKDQEDSHTAIEEFLTEVCGEVGKKIHTGRSRNDQILVAMRLFSLERVDGVLKRANELVSALAAAKKKYARVAMPGYTHMQRAMPTTVATWLGSYADSLRDDLVLLKAARVILDQNPLGSAAGYGESVLGNDRSFTASELDFSKVQRNPMYCAMSRGKFEVIVLQALSQVMFTVGKFASDLLLFTTKEFGFFDLPMTFKTGSSIMPQKKNFDVLELMRGNVGIFQGYLYQVQSVITNLPLGYNRDFQLTKEPYMKGIRLAMDTISIATYVVKHLIVNSEALSAACTPDLYATDEAHRLVKKGMPFREAYREVGRKYLK